MDAELHNPTVWAEYVRLRDAYKKALLAHPDDDDQPIDETGDDAVERLVRAEGDARRALDEFVSGLIPERYSDE